MLLKLKRTPGLYLVGFMGSGKSAVGRLLADELGWSFADIDEDIEKAQGISIAEVAEGVCRALEEMRASASNRDPTSFSRRLWQTLPTPVLAQRDPG